MAVKVKTDNPEALWEKIKEAVEQDEPEDSIKSWLLEEGDLTHGADQLQKVGKKAWFRPVFENGVLTFKVIGRKGEVLTRYGYAEQHGKLVAMLITHFFEEFDSVYASSSPLASDNP